MKVERIYTRSVIGTARHDTIEAAASTMRRFHVGALLVVEKTEPHPEVVGIVTDRDLVVEVMAQEVDPAQFTVGDLMSRELLTAREEDGVYETIQRMRTHGVRRVPVVDASGGLVGIVSIDDLFSLLAEEMTDLARVTSREQAVEAAVRH